MRLYGAAGDGTGDTFAFQAIKVRSYIAVQATAPVGTTTLIQGRMGADHSWLTLVSLADTAGATVASFPFYQAVVSGSAGGDVVVDLAHS